MNLIAAADANWGIGFKNRLLAHIPEDMAFFKEKTMGNPVVMGRKTLESLPGGQPLKGRVNLVLTRESSFQRKGIVTAHSIRELLCRLAPYAGKDIYVIGGASVYRQLLGFCDTAYVTRISCAYQADAFLPDLDGQKEWELTDCGEEQASANGLKYRFLTYRRKQKLRNAPLALQCRQRLGYNWKNQKSHSAHCSFRP